MQRNHRTILQFASGFAAGVVAQSIAAFEALAQAGESRAPKLLPAFLRDQPDDHRSVRLARAAE